tara:strand:+ start:824 stop:1399 length:576 start_codon:yes stop_codon:yes gene_type:complete
MKIFTNLYNYVINLAKKENVLRYLYGLSFIESFIFPLPPDILLAPIALTRKYNWIRLAFFTTIYSVLGGIIGYIIGSYLFEVQLFNNIISEEKFIQAKNLFNEHGFLIIFIAGFTPIPYKAFTITAGYMSIAFIPFLAASFVGRGFRFFLVSAIFYLFGLDRANKLRNYFEYIGYVATILLIIYIFMRYSR